MNATHEEAVEFAKISKRENRVYVGNLSYDVRYSDLMEFMRGGGLLLLSLSFSEGGGCGGEAGQWAWSSEWGRERSLTEYHNATKFTTFSHSFMAWFCWAEAPQVRAGSLLSGSFWGCRRRGPICGGPSYSQRSF